MADEKWLTIKEAAERLNLPAPTVRYWCRRGWLEATSRISGQGIRVSESSVEAAAQPVPLRNRRND